MNLPPTTLQRHWEIVSYFFFAVVYSCIPVAFVFASADQIDDKYIIAVRIIRPIDFMIGVS